MTEPKIVGLIKEARQLKAKMDELKESSSEVAQYLELESGRKEFHSLITSHIEQYNVNAELYKPMGLVGRLNRNIKVSDVETLVAIKPSLKSILLPLINESQSYYTK